jgi:hypothetical protein
LPTGPDAAMVSPRLIMHPSRMSQGVEISSEMTLVIGTARVDSRKDEGRFESGW